MIIVRMLTLGAVGAAIYGIVRGVRNGTFQQWAKNIPNKLNMQNLQQATQPLQQMTQPLQGMANNPLTEKAKQQGF